MFERFHSFLILDLALFMYEVLYLQFKKIILLFSSPSSSNEETAGVNIMAVFGGHKGLYYAE